MDELLIAQFEDEIALERAVGAFGQLGLEEIDDFTSEGEGYSIETDPNDTSHIIRIQIGQSQVHQMITILKRSGGRMISGSSRQSTALS